MSKTVRLEDQVYLRLDNLRGKRETFSDVIDALLGARLSVLELMNILEGQIKFREWQREQRDVMPQARAERADLNARTLKQ